MCIGTNTLNDMLNRMGAIDFKYLTLAAISLDVTAVDTASIKYKNNPDNKLVRHEFLEFLVRASKTKVLAAGEATCISEALQKFYEDYCVSFFTQKNPETFRNTVYWTAEIDFVYKVYLPFLKTLYKKYSGAAALPGQKTFMSHWEMLSMIREGELKEEILDREVPMFFNVSMMTQVDELNENRCFEMKFVEFLEAFGRLASEASLPRVGIKKEKREEMAKEEREA